MKAVPAVLCFSLAAFAAENLIVLTVLPDDDSFNDLPFSSELLQQLPDWGTGSEVFELPSWQPYTKDYLFSDGVLTIESHGTENFIRYFVPSAALTEEEALLVGDVISKGSTPPFRERDELAVIHGEDSPSGAGCMLRMNLNEEGLVTGISFMEWSP